MRNADGTQASRGHRLAAVAIAEWRRWGALDVQRLPGGGSCACLGTQRCEPIDDGCGREQQTPWCRLVDEYWQRTFVVSGRWFHHDCSRVDICEARWPAGTLPIDTPAWSAAFISTVADRAGFKDEEFLKTPYHADYIRAAMDGRTSAYRVVPVPAAVGVGDLICGARVPLPVIGTGPYAFAPLVEGGLPPLGRGAPVGGSAESQMAAIVDTRTARRPTPMHCDLVVSVEPGEARAIGGNVMQAVARVRYPLAPDGRLARGSDAQAGGPLLVMQLR